MQLRLLRLFLGLAAFGWGISIVGVFVSWPEAAKLLEGFGAKPIAYDPMLDYWLRMTSGAFALVGVWFLAMMIWPQKFSAAIPWFGALMIAEGIILLFHGLRLSLSPFPFYADVSGCFVEGFGILLLSRHAMSAAVKELPGKSELPESLSNFTPRAQQVLALARGEADRLHHNYIGTEHVLLGLIALGQGVAVNVLGGLGLNLENIRTEVEKITGTGPAENIATKAPYTPRVKKVLDLARREAKNLNHTYIGTEHLLLGLLREGDGIGAKALRNRNVDLEKLRISIFQELHPNFISEIPVDPEVEPSKNLGFTPRAFQAFAFAREEAERLHQNGVGTDHLLLGIIKLEQDKSINLLKSLGLDLDTIRAEVEKRTKVASDEKSPGKIPFTPRVNYIVKMAKEEAEALKHTRVGTEHLSLALLREPDGPAAEIFKLLKVDVEVARKKILDELNPLSN
jgi:hypothetical protein